jgi:hypothetical protein
MNKFIVSSIIIMSIFIGANVSNLNSSSAQQNITPASTNLTTDFKKFFTGNKDFQYCIKLTLCSDKIDVLYQDNSTIALESSYDMIWKAVSAVKKDGYKIDGFSTFAETDILGKDQKMKTLVVMSK